MSGKPFIIKSISVSSVKQQFSNIQLRCRVCTPDCCHIPASFFCRLCISHSFSPAFIQLMNQAISVSEFPSFIPLSLCRIVYRLHIFLEYVIKLFLRIPRPIQFLTCPYGMQIIAVASFIQVSDSRFFLY